MHESRRRTHEVDGRTENKQIKRWCKGRRLVFGSALRKQHCRRTKIVVQAVLALHERGELHHAHFRVWAGRGVRRQPNKSHCCIFLRPAELFRLEHAQKLISSCADSSAEAEAHAEPHTLRPPVELFDSSRSIALRFCHVGLCAVEQVSFLCGLTRHAAPATR